MAYQIHDMNSYIDGQYLFPNKMENIWIRIKQFGTKESCLSSRKMNLWAVKINACNFPESFFMNSNVCANIFIMFRTLLNILNFWAKVEKNNSFTNTKYKFRRK